MARALAAIDAAHAADPGHGPGTTGELQYAQRLTAWMQRLVPAPTPALRLAARAQHLERWAIPRASFPMDRAGYHRWRRAVHQRQGQRAAELLSAVGVDPATTARVQALVAKALPLADPEAQALEDAACLTFLADELAAFAASHADYSRERLLTILRKTWAKMSAQGRSLAGTIPLTPELAALVAEATRG